MKIRTKQEEQNRMQRINQEYEWYKDRDVLGIDLATVINKAVNNNEKQEIEKDKDGYYIEDENYSIKVEIYMITNNTTYQMEAIYKLGVTRFIENFNLVSFKCTDIEYHKKTGLVSKLYFTQTDEFSYEI